MQEGQPIAYLSKALSPKHLGLSTYENELLVIIMATKKWRTYLLGQRFVIKTDHEALKHFLEQKLTTLLQQKWLSKMLGFDYVISYKKEKDNFAADALSRIPENQVSCAHILINNCKWKEDLLQSFDTDPKIQELLAQYAVTGQLPDEYELKDGLVFKGGKYYVGKGSELRGQIIENLHNSSEGGHSGVAATIKRIENQFFWPQIKQEVTKWVKECEVCQRNKTEHIPTPGLL